MKNIYLLFVYPKQYFTVYIKLVQLLHIFYFKIGPGAFLLYFVSYIF